MSGTPARSPLTVPEYGAVRVELHGAVAVLVLDGPRGNALTRELAGDLYDALLWARNHHDSIRALVLTGEGPMFSSGGDVEMFAQSGDQAIENVQRAMLYGAGCVTALSEAEFPSICALNGPVIGGALGFALACDIRVASTKGTFSPLNGRLGLTPDLGTSWFLVSRVGRGRALEILLEERNLKPRRLLELGLVSEVVEPDELLPTAIEKARRLAMKSSSYVAAARSLVGEASRRSLAEHLRHDHHCVEKAWMADDFAEGLQAFNEGRPPRFG